MSPRVTADAKVIEPRAFDADAFSEKVLAYAEQILDARGFFEFVGEATIQIEQLDVPIPFDASRISGQYTVDFAARRVGQHVADAIVAATAHYDGMDRAALEKHLKLPLTKLRQLVMGKEAAPTERFHQLAKLLAEQLFATHEAYQFSGTHPANMGIWKLLAGVKKYTGKSPGAKGLAYATVGSLFGVPVESPTLEGAAADRSVPGGSRFTKGQATAGGVTLSEVALGLGGVFGLLGAIGAGPALLVAGGLLAALGPVYASSEIGRTRALHEIVHVIQFEILGSALNDGLITPEDFFSIMYDPGSSYAFAGGTEFATDVAAFGKVLGDTFAWFDLKARSYFARRAARGDLTAHERLDKLLAHVRNVRSILEQEGYSAELRTGKDLGGGLKGEGKRNLEHLALERAKLQNERGGPT